MDVNQDKLVALAICVFLGSSGCASQDKPAPFNSEPVFVAQPSVVRVKAKPEGVKVDLGLRSGKMLSCLSPCELDTSRQRITSITISGEGLETLNTNKPFVDNDYNREVISFRLRPNFEAEILAQLLPPGQREVLNQDIALRKVAPAICPADAVPPPKANPLVRLPPRMPVELGKSGACNMTFNVNAYGYLVDIAADCTDEGFAPAATESLKKWSYAPRIEDGTAVPSCGVTTKVKFVMMNSRGEVLPE